MKWKLDENLPTSLKQALATLGHDAETAADEGLLSRSDRVIGAAAKAEDRVLLTLDTDFGDLRRFPPGTHPGIVLFRPRSMGPEAVRRMILEFVRKSDPREIAGSVVIAEPGRTRSRRPPPPGSK